MERRNGLRREEEKEVETGPVLERERERARARESERERERESGRERARTHAWFSLAYRFSFLRREHEISWIKDDFVELLFPRGESRNLKEEERQHFFYVTSFMGFFFAPKVHLIACSFVRELIIGAYFCSRHCMHITMKSIQ